MNIKQVKERWTLERLLGAMGYQPDPRKSKGHDLWYKSPFRPQESTPSFHIHTGYDAFKDFGLVDQSGGDLIAFVQCWLAHQGKESSISAVLEWFRGFSGESPSPLPVKTFQSPLKREAAAFKILSVKPVFSKALFNYLAERGISKAVGTQFLEQVYFLHRPTGKRIYGLGIRNEKDGYEVRNPLGFKGVLGEKAVSFIPGADRDGETLEVYEGFFDFLSGVELAKQQDSPLSDSVIMHTSTLHEPVAEMIRARGYRKVRLWLDNDQAGEESSLLLQQAFAGTNLVMESMNEMYSDSRDLNEWYANADY